MADLTVAEITFCKNLKKKKDLENDIVALNNTAQTAMDTKRTELTALQNKLSSDVKVKQDLIDAL